MFFSHLMIYSTAKIRQVFGTTKLLEQKVIAHQDNDRAVMAGVWLRRDSRLPKGYKKTGRASRLGESEICLYGEAELVNKYLLKGV